MTHKLFTRTRNFRADRDGSVAVLAGAIFVVIAAIGGLVLQEAILYQAKSRLQTNVNMAALAGASALSAGTSVTTAVNTYTASNSVAGLAPTTVSGYPSQTCLTTTGAACASGSANNAIVVKNQVSMNLLFGGLFGAQTATLTATASASESGGQGGKNADVVMIIDTTASMNDKDSSCSISGDTELQCAMAGAQNMLKNFNPGTTNVALMVFPPVKTNVKTEYCGSTSAITTENYESATTLATTTPTTMTSTTSTTSSYLVLGFSNDYKTSTSATTLNTSSNLVKAVSGVSGCVGVQAIGGSGTYYAGVIADAQTYLTKSGRAGANKVILFLSDGDANATSSNVPSGMASNQCHEGITQAQIATKAGTTVYTAAYGSPTSGSCSTDTATPISACTAMSEIASSASTFFPINEGGAGSCTSSTNTNTDAATALATIGQSIIYGSSGPRLWTSQ